MGSLFTVVAGRRAKWLVALVWVLAVGAALAANLPGKLADAENNESSSYLPSSAESTKALDATKRLEGGELAPLVIVYHRDGGLTGADRRVIARDRTILNRKKLRATSTLRAAYVLRGRRRPRWSSRRSRRTATGTRSPIRSTRSASAWRSTAAAWW